MKRGEGVVAKVKVQSRGQITLPKAIRDLFDLREGDELLVEPEGESRIALVVLPKPRSVFDLGDLVDPNRGPADFAEARELGRQHFVQRWVERSGNSPQGLAVAEAVTAKDSPKDS